MFDLYEHRDKQVLVSFHPFAWTAFYAARMKSKENREVLSTLKYPSRWYLC